MTKSERRARQQADALTRRIEREQRHAAMLIAHAERRTRKLREQAEHDAAVRAYHAAYIAWLDSGEVGPVPVHPDEAAAINGDRELRKLAAEVGITL